MYGNRTHRELCSNPPLVLKTRAPTRGANTPKATQVIVQSSEHGRRRLSRGLRGLRTITRKRDKNRHSQPFRDQPATSGRQAENKRRTAGDFPIAGFLYGWRQGVERLMQVGCAGRCVLRNSPHVDRRTVAPLSYDRKPASVLRTRARPSWQPRSHGIVEISYFR